MNDSGKLYGGYDYDYDAYTWCLYWHPGKDPDWTYSMGNPKYDFGVVELLPRLCNNKHVGDIVQPFVVMWDYKIDQGTKWVTLAYPCHRDNPSIKTSW